MIGNNPTIKASLPAVFFHCVALICQLHQNGKAYCKTWEIFSCHGCLIIL